MPSDAKGQPKPGAQRNFTDPESRIQKTQSGFIQGFNAQAARGEWAHIYLTHNLLKLYKAQATA